jgi:hypothetical protein
MKTFNQKLLAAVTGIAVGLLSFYLINGWYNVIPWAAVALLTGYFSISKKDALFNGSIFGYLLFLSYIIIGYRGNLDTNSLLKFSLFTVLFSLVGAIIGLVGGFSGFLVKGRNKKKN